jgi:GNAT superfamily N-acetyltransferase
MNIVPAAETNQRLEGIWPEFLLHDAISNLYWERLRVDFAEFQFVMLDGDVLVAEANCIPVSGQPLHWRDAFLNGFEGGGKPDRVCALAIVVSMDYQRRGIAKAMLTHMRELATPIGNLVAPVRPTLKSQYPLFPIDEYITWRRADGLHFDQWLRLHEGVGGTITGTAEEAMVIDAPVADWQEWTGMAFPADGEYVVPGALVPVSVRGGMGVNHEP